MARPKSEIQKHTLNLRAGDYAKMQELFPAKKGGKAIRELISNFIDEIESRVHATPTDIDLPEDHT